MALNILLYGATGFSGQLIAAEGKDMGMSNAEPASAFRMILAARDGEKLREVAERNGMRFRAFALDEIKDAKRQLDGIDVVINAAGPFAFTAEILAKAALEKRCHYVDINGEVDVYRKLDDLARVAGQREVALVSAAGHLAATSDVLLDLALQALEKNGQAAVDGELGAVRIAMSSISDPTRGSVLTLARSLREQVTVIRKGRQMEPGQGASARKMPRSRALPAHAKPKEQMMIWHEPFGRLERTFDFGRLSDGDSRKDSNNRIASGVNLVDTLTARHTVERHKLLAQAIESYAETDTIQRIASQFSGVFASLGTLPWVQTLVKQQLNFLPEGPSPAALQRDRNVIVLEIEDIYRRRLIDWRWATPNVYQLTAQVVVAVACAVAVDKKTGWLTPADALGFRLPVQENGNGGLNFKLRDLEGPANALRNSEIEMRAV